MSSIVDLLLVKYGLEISNNVDWDNPRENKGASEKETKERIEDRAGALASSKITNSPTWSETTSAASATCTDARINAKVSDSPSWTSTTVAPSAKAADDRINAKVSNTTNWSAPSCTVAPSENSVGAQITSVANAKVTDSPVWNETTVAPSARAIKSCIDANGAVCNTPTWSETTVSPSAGATETRINARTRSCYVTTSCGTINLSANRCAVYELNYDSVSGTVATGAINFTCGSAGELIYLKVNSGGSGSYSFGANMKFPSGAAPVPSAQGKVDLYSFLTVGSSTFLGTFAFNYTV